jgi:hypothetical protein
VLDLDYGCLRGQPSVLRLDGGDVVDEMSHDRRYHPAIVSSTFRSSRSLRGRLAMTVVLMAVSYRPAAILLAAK